MGMRRRPAVISSPPSETEIHASPHEQIENVPFPLASTQDIPDGHAASVHSSTHIRSPPPLSAQTLGVPLLLPGHSL